MIRAGDAAALERLVTHNMRFVVYVIKSSPQYAASRIPFDDLIGIGNAELLKAARRWTPKNGARFSTYAKGFIQRGIRRSLDNEWSMIRIPVNVAEQIRNLRYTERRLTQELKRKPTHHELADALKLHESRIEELMSIDSLEPMSIDANQGQGRPREEIEE